MNFNQYQKLGRDTWVIDKSPEIRAILGLVGESGEIAELTKKAYRGDFKLEDKEKFRELMKKELGDLFYYLNRVADIYDLSLEDIAKANIDKLQDRKKRGVLKGSGSNR